MALGPLVAKSKREMWRVPHCQCELASGTQEGGSQEISWERLFFTKDS